MINDRIVIVRIEPSRRLSEIIGFPHFIEKRSLASELLAKGIITEADIVEMLGGKEIQRDIKVVK